MLRSYQDPCGIARALDLVGERWSLLVVRELLFGPKRFTDLRDGLAGASPNVLSQRLRELEAAGVVRKHTEGAAAYELTEFGQELHPILLLLGRWGARSGQRVKGALSVDALMAALEATFEGPAAFEGTLELRLGEVRYAASVHKQALRIRRGPAPRANASIVTDASTLRAVAFGDQKLSDAALEIQGDRSLARAFLRSFRRPIPA